MLLVMVYLTKKDAEGVVRELSKSKDKHIKEVVKKIKSPAKIRVYVNDKQGIERLLKKAFSEKRKIKIRYYSPNTDEHTTRVIDIYRAYTDAIIAFCHLRDEERTFAIERINSAALLDEKYEIPKGWRPESIILDK